MSGRTSTTDDWPGARPTATGARLGPERRRRARKAAREEGDGAGRSADDADPGQPSGATADDADPGQPSGATADLDVDLAIEDGGTTLFEAGINAFHAGEYTRAESLFLEEAARALDTAPQRAAIAYRQAALAARSAGNLDGSDHWMRLAGREYLRVSEDVRTPLPFIREAAVMAAKCFLSVENLHVATKGLRRAQAIESVLRADDDLLASSTGIPFRHETAGSPPDVPGAGTTAPADAGGDDPAAGWVRRLRQRLPRRNAA